MKFYFIKNNLLVLIEIKLFIKCNAEVDPELTLVSLSLVLFAPILRKQNLQVTPVGSKLLIIYLIKQLLQSNHSIFVSVLLDFQHTYLVLISFHLIQIDKIPSGSKYQALLVLIGLYKNLTLILFMTKVQVTTVLQTQRRSVVIFELGLF